LHSISIFKVAFAKPIVLHWCGKHKSNKRGVERGKMDFTNRSAQPNGPAPAGATVGTVSTSSHRKNNHDDNGKWARVGIVAAIAAVVILIIGAILLISTAGNADNETKYVDTSKLQAVFLNTGQVYFGNIKDLNSKYFVLTNIYYLQTNSSSSSSSSTTSSNNVSLVKLGCELHQPYDQMVINSDEVTFWENLQSTGQVAKAVATFQQQNPNGQKCTDQSSAASTTSGSSTQNAGTGSTTGSSTTGTGN
jgi:hypothetical protein